MKSLDWWRRLRRERSERVEEKKREMSDSAIQRAEAWREAQDMHATIAELQTEVLMRGMGRRQS